MQDCKGIENGGWSLRGNEWGYWLKHAESTKIYIRHSYDLIFKYRSIKLQHIVTIIVFLQVRGDDIFIYRSELSFNKIIINILLKIVQSFSTCSLVYSILREKANVRQLFFLVCFLISNKSISFESLTV